jgi:hypothetical protein
LSTGGEKIEASERWEALLDEALILTFPASDPIAIGPPPVDAGKWFEEHQRKHPPAAFTEDDLVRRYQRGSRALLRRNPFRLIRQYVSCFHYKAAETTLAVRPDDSMLESLAELFKEWLSGSGSLDEVFGLVRRGSGRKSLREQYLRRKQGFVARLIYDDLRASGLLQKQAVGEVATLLRITESKAHALIFRRRTV